MQNSLVETAKASTTTVAPRHPHRRWEMKSHHHHDRARRRVSRATRRMNVGSREPCFDVASVSLWRSTTILMKRTLMSSSRHASDARERHDVTVQHDRLKRERAGGADLRNGRGVCVRARSSLRGEFQRVVWLNVPRGG